MKSLPDHCVPNRVVAMLAEAAHEVIRLRDCLPPDSTDPVVLQKEGLEGTEGVDEGQLPSPLRGFSGILLQSGD